MKLKDYLIDKRMPDWEKQYNRRLKRQKEVRKELEKLGFEFRYFDNSYGHNKEVYNYKMKIKYKNIDIIVTLIVRISNVDKDNWINFKYEPYIGQCSLCLPMNGSYPVVGKDDTKSSYYAKEVLKGIESDKTLIMDIKRHLDEMTRKIPEKNLPKFFEDMEAGWIV